MPAVAISKVIDLNDSESIAGAVREAVELACDFASMYKGKSVVLKPNVYCCPPMEFRMKALELAGD